MEVRSKKDRNCQSLTHSGLVDADVKGSHQVLQEHSHQSEVEPADAPRAVHQDHDVGHGLGATHKLIGCEHERKKRV